MTEQDDDKDFISWWTPTGWEWKPLSEALRKTDEIAAAMGDEFIPHEEPLRKAGYERLKSVGSEHNDEFDVWRHKDGHLYVDMIEHGSFLVRKCHATPFWVELYPRLVQRAYAENVFDVQEFQQKAILAFVRHGHGKSTISEFGLTREEMDNERLERQHEAARKAAAKKTTDP